MFPLIVLLPLIAAIIAVAVSRNHGTAKYIALAGSLVSLALFPFLSSGTARVGWLEIGGAALGITATLAPLNSLLLLAVLLIGPLVLLYSFGFMDVPSEQRRFYLEMLAFEAAMLAFAMSGNFVLLFIAWEFLSVTSYLTIGFWNWRDGANRGARKAITLVLIGDLALLGAMVILFSVFGTLEFSGIVGAMAVTRMPLSAAALLVIAVLSKSAQFPFHEWLPDATEGPAPALAFLNSSTMVKAGVFAAIALFPLFSAAGMLPVLFYAGLVTAALGTLNAVMERRINRVLAYSTMQGLGLMLMAVGSGALLAAAYFLFMQSFYTALLFLCTGVGTRANGKDNLFEMGGLTRNRIAYFTALFGALSLAGFVPFGGFFANMSLAGSFTTNLAAYAFISLIGLGTSFYIFRWFVPQTKKTSRVSVAVNYAAVPKSMSLSAILLAGATLISGAAFFIIPGYVNGAPSLGPAWGTLQASGYCAASVTAVALAGAAMGYLVYRQKKKSALRAPSNNLTGAGYAANAMNSVYAYLAAFVLAFGDGIDRFDSAMNGAFDGLGHAVMLSGNSVKRAASGEINTYVVIFAVGMLLLILAVAIA
jgi:NADH-quinone oxidoreductase subunit L